MSSELRILYSLPSSLSSVPPYLVTSTRSPFLTSNGTFFPLSSVLPVPRATTRLSIGFSLAVSGIMIPPFLTSFSSTGSTRIRSPRGLTFSAIVWFVSVGFDVNQNPAALTEGNSLLLFIDNFGVDDRAFFFLGVALGLLAWGVAAGLALASSG